MNTRILLASVTFGLLLTGCADDKPANSPVTPSVDDGASAATQRGSGPAGDSSRDGQLVIDSALAKLCNITASYFGFDSANLGKDGRDALDALATCFTTGPAKDRSLAIIGHADPRGEVTYNFGLGQRRAGTVENHLTMRGVPEARIETSSRGELDAVGADESGWAKDRKVQIMLRN